MPVDSRDAARLCRNEVRKARACLGLNLARDANNNRKSFYRHVKLKMKFKENICP